LDTGGSSSVLGVLPAPTTRMRRPSSAPATI
jgi:hypothetical protein